MSENRMAFNMTQNFSDIILHLYRKYSETATWIKLLPYRLFGLKVGSRPNFAQGICFSKLYLKNITIGNNVSLGERGYVLILQKQGRICIGDGTYICDDFFISSHAPVSIGKNCLFSFKVTILGHSHPVGWGVNPVTSGYEECAPTSIGEGCFIGCYAIIMPGVRLGDYCVVGANSVVTKSFPAGSVIAGNPASLMRSMPGKNMPN
jgi:acetyltransferase-like isoleucine patch superfamily enzyme